MKWLTFQIWFWTQVKKLLIIAINIVAWVYSWILTIELYRRHHYNRKVVPMKDVFVHVHPIFKKLLHSYIQGTISEEAYIRFRNDIRNV